MQKGNKPVALLENKAYFDFTIINALLKKMNPTKIVVINDFNPLLVTNTCPKIKCICLWKKTIEYLP